jgi:hypothetical protein
VFSDAFERSKGVLTEQPNSGKQEGAMESNGEREGGIDTEPQNNPLIATPDGSIVVVRGTVRRNTESPQPVIYAQKVTPIETVEEFFREKEETPE